MKVRLRFNMQREYIIEHMNHDGKCHVFIFLYARKKNS